jgi:hypothetical protein
MTRVLTILYAAMKGFPAAAIRLLLGHPAGFPAAAIRLLLGHKLV